MEVYGSLWKTQEQSIGKLGKHGECGPESSTKEEGKDYVRRGAVHDRRHMVFFFFFFELQFIVLSLSYQTYHSTTYMYGE